MQLTRNTPFTLMRLSCGRSPKVYVLIAVNTVTSQSSVYLQFPVVLCGCRSAANRGLNRTSVKGANL